MSKPETRDDVRQRKIIAQWQPRLKDLAGLAQVKPALVRLTLATVAGDEPEIRICVGGLDEISGKRNLKAVAKAIRELPDAAVLPPINTGRCGHNCGAHFAAAPRL